jgi:hypothetical protein
MVDAAADVPGCALVQGKSPPPCARPPVLLSMDQCYRGGRRARAASWRRRTRPTSIEIWRKLAVAARVLMRGILNLANEVLEKILHCGHPAGGCRGSTGRK